jgi:hypothetical protein
MNCDKAVNTTRHVNGVTYNDLHWALIALGFEVRERPEARSYLHRASGAFIVYPAFPLTDTALLHHVLEARATVDGFGVTNAADFDLLLIQEAKPSPTAA